MALIPAELRAPAAPIVGVQGDVAGAPLATLLRLVPGAVTIGVACARNAASSVRVGGVEAVAGSGFAVAAAATRLEQRGGRIFGVMCLGVAPAGRANNVIAFDKSAPASSLPKAPAGDFGETVLRNPLAVPATVVVEGYVDDVLIIDGVAEALQVSGSWQSPWPRNFRLERSLPVGGALTLGVRNRTPDGIPVNSWVLRGTATFLPTPPLDWRPAVAALSWARAGLPWWGQIEASARAGQWVRRAGWSDATRRIRYEAGAGTTPAVAVTQAGTRVTPADFGAAEFLATDWLLVASGEPAAVDVTDAFITGSSGSVFFAVVGSGGSGNGGGSGGEEPPVGDPTEPPLPTSGQGFLYLKNGVATLVPARDIAGEDWEP